MSRLLALAAVAALASGCYEPAYVPAKPTPAAIVRDNAAAEMTRAFAEKPALKDNLKTFLDKLGDATTTAELRAAWAEAYPDHERVLRRAISKSIHDFYWPVLPVTDGRVYVEGFRAAAEELMSAESAEQS
ncbi:MAG TPA: hypothetical protein VJU16_04675 [Planctomycetota bacterium]|nr:hypothetical protein [Planctomycetota bacterium]